MAGVAAEMCIALGPWACRAQRTLPPPPESALPFMVDRHASARVSFTHRLRKDYKNVM